MEEATDWFIGNVCFFVPNLFHRIKIKWVRQILFIPMFSVYFISIPITGIPALFLMFISLSISIINQE